MALEFDADFDGYFDDSYGHGVSATYTVSGGSATTIKVILEDEYLSVDGLTVGVESSTPVAYWSRIETLVLNFIRYFYNFDRYLAIFIIAYGLDFSTSPYLY